MRIPACFALIACFLAGCATESSLKKWSPPIFLTERGPVRYNPQEERIKILAAIPRGWSQIPHQDERQKRLTDAFFSGPGHEAFILVGPRPNYFELTDDQGKTHREYIAKECLYIWIVPGDFEPKFTPLNIFWLIDPPWRPFTVFVSRDVRVYADISHYVADMDHFHQVLKASRKISSPEIHLSWKSWQRDIATSLK